ncbi:MAG: twin-arginine translocation signal domain-containing protein [Anaerolineae bacterium]|nr:twin-arginine translocation signal domain-containing protein [Anaerolineae bacterium]
MTKEVSRREFLKAALVTGLAVGLLGTPAGLNAAQEFYDERGVGGLPWVVGQRLEALRQATAATFSPLIGTGFHLKTATGVASLTLIEVSPGQSYPTHASFSLLFRAPSGVHLISDTYTVEHATLGTLYLFLSSIGPSGEVYEACFTRLRTGAV